MYFNQRPASLKTSSGGDSDQIQPNCIFGLCDAYRANPGCLLQLASIWPNAVPGPERLDEVEQPIRDGG